MFPGAGKFRHATAKSFHQSPLLTCGVNGSQVRKDLAYFGEFGIRGVGYHVKSLIAAITSSLGVDREWRMALIGVGNLGKAIQNHGEFRSRGFTLNIFDCDPLGIGDCPRS